MTVVCIDIENTWRDSLTLNKEYDIVREFESLYTGSTMYDIKCDDSVTRPYRADRFHEVSHANS